MTIDGKQIARALKNQLQTDVRSYGEAISLGIIVAHESMAINKFVELKEQFARDVGIQTTVIRLGQMEQTTEKLLQTVLHATKDHDGLILQLPVPLRIELDSVLRLFPLSHDVDVLGYTAFQQFKENQLPILPPVVAAMAEILHAQGIHMQGKKVLIVGEGRLVGEPAAIWARHLGATVSVANNATPNIADLAREANLIILGAGVPGLLIPDMVQDGVIILDAGTSESEGVLKGDADPTCAEKALLFTPTPGGIGPVTVAKVFENIFTLTRLKHTHKS